MPASLRPLLLCAGLGALLTLTAPAALAEGAGAAVNSPPQPLQTGKAKVKPPRQHKPHAPRPTAASGG